MFVAFLLFLGYGFDRFYVGDGEFVFPIGTLTALGVGSVSALSSYYSGDRAVLLSAGAVPIDRALSEETAEASALKLRQLDNVVEEMSIAAGLPKPKVYVVPDPDPNAFATGRDPEHASIAVTRGLLDAVTRDELQAVVAHELSHVRNLDIRLMTVIAAMVGTLALLSDWTSRGVRASSSGGRSRRGRSKGKGDGGAIILLVIWIVAILLAPIVGQMLAMMVSRGREYLADASGAELTRNPLALASALEKIEQAHAPTASVKRGTAHLCIADPLGKSVGLKQGWMPDLLASHPPMANRITALRQMGFQE
ncbi:MAG TPA: M48 family metallopeptidase [Vicinamibacterales bacterium]|nr:M48 family metallopeptidase [Vicinamibacterales bacterium]